MADLFTLWWASAKRAWRGSMSSANSWAWLIGGLLVGLPFAIWNLEMTANGLLGGVIQTALVVGAAWTLIFLARLAVAPGKLYAEALQRIKSLEGELEEIKKGPDCSHRLAIAGLKLAWDCGEGE